jgi:sulfate permease, SulP family
MPSRLAVAIEPLVKLISDSILVGFKAGAGLTHVYDPTPEPVRSDQRWAQLFRAGGAVAMRPNERLTPGKPIALGVVALAIGLPALGIPRPGRFRLACPPLGARPCNAGARCLLTSKGSPPRVPLRQNTDTDWTRGRSFSAGAANLAAPLGHGHPVAGRFFKAVLAAVVLTAVYELLDFPALVRMWHASRLDFYAAMTSVDLLVCRWPHQYFSGTKRLPFKEARSSYRCLLERFGNLTGGRGSRL